MPQQFQQFLSNKHISYFPPSHAFAIFKCHRYCSVQIFAWSFSDLRLSEYVCNPRCNTVVACCYQTCISVFYDRGKQIQYLLSPNNVHSVVNLYDLTFIDEPFANFKVLTVIWQRSVVIVMAMFLFNRRCEVLSLFVTAGYQIPF